MTNLLSIIPSRYHKPLAVNIISTSPLRKIHHQEAKFKKETRIALAWNTWKNKLKANKKPNQIIDLTCLKLNDEILMRVLVFLLVFPVSLVLVR